MPYPGLKPYFTDAPLLQPLADGCNWELHEKFGFWTPRTGLIMVPAGFVTDLASIPRLFWNILPPFGKYTRAAIVHDWLYRTQMRTRETADRVLWDGMVACGVPWWQRVIIYQNVRWFGFAAWADDSRHLFRSQK